MARNVVLCFDGTNNQFGSENTNVVRVAQTLDRDPARQRLFYDPGVGTLPEPGAFTRTGKWLSKVLGLAFGRGLFLNVEEAYAYLMDFWEPGDRVFLFGFSRGAYTARVLAAVLHQMGLLPRGNYNLVPYVTRLFRALPSKDEGMGEYFKLSSDFRYSFARIVPESDDRRFRVHYLGLWDTVSSVGWVWDPPAYPYTARNPSVDVIRHAISIDERRWFFRQNRMSQAERQDLQERWFPGVHSDVGGGYPEDQGGLWRRGLAWVLDGAVEEGLSLDQSRLRTVAGGAEPQGLCGDSQHESLRSLWWVAEFFPKLQRRKGFPFRLPALGLGRNRFIHEGAMIDQCALIRLRDKPDYRPSNLSADFVRRVQDLQAVPSCLPYKR